MNTQLPIWSKTPPCKLKASYKNSHSDNNKANNEDGYLSKPWTNVDFTLKLTREEWEHFCNPCVHCWLSLLSFLDAISEREEWVTVLSCNELWGGVPCQLAEKEFGGRCFSGDHGKHPASNSGASILGIKTTWEMKMLKNRTDKENFDQMVHPQEQGTLITLLRILERHRSDSMAAEICSLGNFISLQPLNDHVFEKIHMALKNSLSVSTSELVCFTCQEAIRELSISELLGSPSAENQMCLSFWENLPHQGWVIWGFPGPKS